MKTIVSTLTVIALLHLGTAQAAEYSRTRVVTGENGKTASRTAQGSYVPGEGGSRTVTRTGPNGNSATTSRTTTPLPHGRSTQVTGPNGNSWNKSVYRGPFGHVRGVSVTGPQGNTRRILRVR